MLAGSESSLRTGQPHLPEMEVGAFNEERRVMKYKEEVLKTIEKLKHLRLEQMLKGLDISVSYTERHINALIKEFKQMQKKWWEIWK